MNIYHTKTYHFEAKITHCVAVEADGYKKAVEKALREFNDAERLSEIVIEEDDLEVVETEL